ncbi:MAG TPA: carboxypeptidase-like regulatory domain-containing protein, partial [Bacteroidales bacterium]|nr:carboxypeptidase-like regulatory domain-containing protein [Bacteroidales bacterium]
MNLKIARTTFLLITISFCSLNILAQPHGGGSGNYSGNMAPIGSIKGAVINSVDGKPLAYAYIRLFKLADSSLVNGGISDSLGKFSIEKIPFGKYYMTVTLLGHKSVNIDHVLITPKEPNKILDAISLDAGATTLQTFEVTEKKQAVEYSLDKKIINVDKALVSTGGNAIDVMQSIPSVTVDIDGNLSMRGNSNVTVLVDGKPSAL